jgi:hypothetical protein
MPRTLVALSRWQSTHIQPLWLVQGFFNSPPSLGIFTSPIASSTIARQIFPGVTLGQSLLLLQRMATWWWFTSAPISKHFRSLILWLLSVLSWRFPRLSWLGVGSSLPGVGPSSTPAAPPDPTPSAAKQFGILPAPSSSATLNDAFNGSQVSSSLLTSPSIGSPNANQREDPPSLGSTSQVPVPIGSLPAVCNICIPPYQLPQATNFLHPPCPDPKGFDGPPFPMGGRPYQTGGGTPPVFGGHFPAPGGSYGGPHLQPQVFSYPSFGSMADHWHLFNFPGGPSMAVPSFIHGPSPQRPSHGGLPICLHLWRLRSLLRLPRCAFRHMRTSLLLQPWT